MDQKRFAVSWGRKMFFGLSLPLICLFGMSYFQTKIFPQSALEFFYLAVTYIGHYGVLTSLLFFIFYVPFAWLFPTYYMTRSAVILLTIIPCLLITVDSMLYGFYRIHIDRFIIQMFIEGAGNDVLSFSQGTLIVACTIFVALVFYIWFHGEKIWRHMQRRFNNENSNWYFVVIVFCFFISHFLHIYADGFGERKILRHSESFFLHFPATARKMLANGNLLPKKIEVQKSKSFDFNYPMTELLCEKNNTKNIIFFTVKDLDSQRFSIGSMPYLAHLSSHGKIFSDHKAQNFDVESGVFSLLYGLPSTYLPLVKRDQRPPVFINELRLNDYHVGVFSELDFSLGDLRQTTFLGQEVKTLSSDFKKDFFDWMKEIQFETNKKSFFMFSIFENQDQLNKNIETIVEYLAVQNVSKETIFVITGLNTPVQTNELSVPLILIWPEVSGYQMNQLTTHLDIVPTFMKYYWQCKNPIASYSDGQSLTDLVPRDWLMAGEGKSFKIFDYLKKQVVSVSSTEGLQVRDFQNNPLTIKDARYGLIFEILKNQSRFRK